MGQMEKKGMVRKTLGTPDISAPTGPGGTTPFSCQQFPIGAKSEQLLPRKIRKALKFYTLEIFGRATTITSPPSLNSCFKIPNEQVSQHSKRRFPQCPQRTKSRGYAHGVSVLVLSPAPQKAVLTSPTS